MTGPSRVGTGLFDLGTDTVQFRFDGTSYAGRAGDTLAAALLANGVRLFGRSFKYHRPRGVYTAGADEPSALVDLLTPSGREPNRLATTVLIHDGLVAESQNRWPSLRFDVGALAGLLRRFLPVGFYYKTFMWPRFAWERLYEPVLRHRAGLGRLPSRGAASAATTATRTVHDHTDVLVVGAGPAGLMAALSLAKAGLRVLLAEQDEHAGGGTLWEPAWQPWREAALSAAAALPNLRLLCRTTVVGAYGHGVYAAVERPSPPGLGTGETFRVIRSQSAILATGSVERLIALPGNDVPGVMLAGAALRYLVGHGVAPGRTLVLFTNNDEAYAAALEAAARGVRIEAIVDVREYSPAADRARGAGLTVYAGARLEAILGRRQVRAVRLRDRDGARQTLSVDSVLLSGGYNPAMALATQLGADVRWSTALAAFVPDLEPHLGRLAGAVHGISGLAAAASDGAVVAQQCAAALGVVAMEPDLPLPLPTDPPRADLEPCWEVAGKGPAFVDLQHDVTCDDVRLARREGYSDVEHMKRYTTHGMGTDQGRMGGLVGTAVLAAARGIEIAEAGLPRARPYQQPVPLATLAGDAVGAHYKPVRRLPLHDWHEAAGALWLPSGLWLRPQVYATSADWPAVLAEARHVRRDVGLTDVSSLGKIEVAGSDAAAFLDYLYATAVSTLPIGRCRYALLLREDGRILDDGTVARLSRDHFLLSTSTAHADTVLEHLDFYRQTQWAQADVTLIDVGDQWAQFALAGPLSRAVLTEAFSDDTDVSNDAVPFMSVRTVKLNGIPARLLRISFSGELGYELAVPARYATPLWQYLLEAGAPLGLKPYGLDALNTLRIEKGHVAAAELNGQTTAAELGLQRLCKPEGQFVGATLARAASHNTGLLELVGVRPVSDDKRLRNGAHLVSADDSTTSLGYLTSATPATEQVGWVGLALLRDGRSRIGAVLNAVSPVHGESIAVEITRPQHLDAENVRVRS